MVTYITRGGQTRTSVFDNRNREISYTWSDGTPGVSRTYDAAGRLLSSSNGVSTSTYSYDNANQLLSETQNAGVGSGWTVGYSYTADGKRSSVTYPSGSVVTYGYTGRNQINTIAVGGTGLASYAYDANGNILNKGLANGTLTGYSYDAANRLTSLNHTLSGTSFARFDYGYDAVNRRTYEKRDAAAGDTYAYDAIDQVTGVNYDATNPATGSTGADRTVGYSYDATGNRTTVTDNVNGTTSYTPNSVNEYSNVGGSAYAYDPNGNLLSGNGLYTYDAQNRLDYAQVGSNIDQFAYDSKNRVVKRTIMGTAMYLVYDGWDLIEERDASNNVLATYVHGVRQDEMLTRIASSGQVYYHHNALGSIVDLTDATGAVVEKYKYDAFGKPTITDGVGNPLTDTAYGNRFMFTGREYLAEVNLYDYRNRVYSADLGRFMQTDPLRFNAGDVNIYRYCGNNPLNGTDPLGLCSNTNDNSDQNSSWWSSFWQGFTDPNAWEQSAAATANGVLTGGGLAPWSAPFSIDPGNEYNQNISSDLGGIADLAFAAAGAVAGGSAFLGGAAEDGEGLSSTYVNTTNPGASVTNITTDATADDAGATLESNGYSSSTSADGQATTYTDANGNTYTIRPSNSAPGGQAADFTPSGSSSPTLKINFGS